MTKEYAYPPEYWNRLFAKEHIGWDIGYISTPLKEYFDQMEDKSVRILIPGSGSGWEAEYLYNAGFENIFYHDFSPLAHKTFLKRVPDFPQSQMLSANFFSLQGKYDLIVEQTFFSSIPRNLRVDYSRQVSHLLRLQGKFVGLLFNHEFPQSFPPFGGSVEEYKILFFNEFTVKTFEIAYNSIKPRQGRELFFILEKTAG